MSSVLEEIAAERARQISAEGWTPEHDDAHDSGDLALAAACYCAFAATMAEYRKPTIVMHTAPTWAWRVPPSWPWSPEWWKPKNDRSDLIRAAALIVAEIERQDRAQSNSPTKEERA